MRLFGIRIQDQLLGLGKWCHLLDIHGSRRIAAAAQLIPVSDGKTDGQRKHPIKWFVRKVHCGGKTEFYNCLPSFTTGSKCKKRGTSLSFPRKRLIKCVPFSTRRKKKRPPLLHSYLAFGKLQALWTKNVLIGDRAQCHLSTVSSPIMPPIAKQMPRTRTLLTALVLLQSNSSVHVFGKESQSHI